MLSKRNQCIPVGSYKPGTITNVWKPNSGQKLLNKFNRFMLEANLSRVRFYPGNRYSYTPSPEYLAYTAKHKPIAFKAY